MYKIFSGGKCIVIVDKPIAAEKNKVKTIIYKSAQQLHQEYKQLIASSKYSKLFVVGNEELVWNVFRSLFLFIEASGGVVRNSEGKLLMIYRNKHWDLPKGKMEPGEIPDQTAVREVEEECGVTGLTITRDLLQTYHIFFQNHHECIKRTYWFEMNCKDTNQPKPQLEEGITKVEWMSKEEVQKVRDAMFLSLQDVLNAASFLS